MLKAKDFHSEAMRKWLGYVSGGESPVIFSSWSLVSAVAACLGRRCYTLNGRLSYSPNLYVILVGPPAVRKSTAASLAVKLLKKYTEIKFGPSDTGGKKQGIISAFDHEYSTVNPIDEVENELASMLTFDLEDDKDEPIMDSSNVFAAAFDQHNQAKKSKEASRKAYAKEGVSSRPRIKMDESVPRDLYIFADELGVFLGQNQADLVNWLTLLYYPQDYYDYKLAKSTTRIYNPGLNIIGCTTPIGLAGSLPPSSIDQGFTSRCVLVYEDKAMKKVFRPPELDEKIEFDIGEMFNHCCQQEGAFELSEGASAIGEELYHSYSPPINDTRFEAYSEGRRNDQLLKVATAFAAMDKSKVISIENITDAHTLLAVTERRMAEALGEVGLDKISLAKQQLIETIKASAPLGIAKSVLQVNALRDMQLRDFHQAIAEFESRKICVVSEVQAFNGNMVEMVVPISKDVSNKPNINVDKILSDRGITKPSNPDLAFNLAAKDANDG